MAKTIKANYRDFEIPNDISGVVYIPMDIHGA
jgi:hypothetical protein